MAQMVEALSRHLFAEHGLPVFAVLDGASILDLLDKFAELRPEYQCLRRGELKPDLAEVAPYLVRLEEGTPFTRWVLEEGWGKHWGIFALAPADLRDMRRHFRTLTMVYDPDGKLLLFRFYDPRVLRVYLPTCNEQELTAVFGPVAGYLLEDEDPGTLLRFQFSAGSLVTEKKQVSPRED